LPASPTSPAGHTERRLLVFAGAFLWIYCLALTLANAARLRSWQVEYRWVHWLGLAVWVALVWLAHQQLERHLPERDPYLLPVTALLTGWGLLTIWRLSTSLGLRQAVWLVLIGAVFTIVTQKYAGHTGDKLLGYLRRFKYVWLISGLLLTAATLVLGTNPLGLGPRLWLGCCGVYFQPSEPLKLLLVVYLAAYLADRLASASPPRHLLALLTPTLILTGLALLLLVFQRDLGTAAIFLALYAVIVFAGTGDYRVLIFSFLVLIAAGIVGYAFFDVVSQRIDAWINPWLDPSGRSYQIVQSLLAIANGGLLGRGPGMGSPGLVPIAQSDFIFSSISEESGLLGALAIFGLLAVLVNRGARLALQSKDNFLRLLATGLIAHLVSQSILIIGGNLRLLPLTGVTLPFVSYGGSSLLVSCFELLCLLLISAHQEEASVLQFEKQKSHSRINLLLSGGLLSGLVAAALVAGWWGLVRGPDLLTRTDNPRRAIDDRYVRRGSILDHHDQALAESSGQPGYIVRRYPHPALGPLIGYTDPIYGQAGLEAALDPYLRGLQGYPPLPSWWEHLLYGTPPPGLDVRLSLDLGIQALADKLLAGIPGAIVLVNAQTGEILVMASSPAFDANELETTWQSLINDPQAPLYNRATMGLYPTGTLLGAFLLPGSQQSANRDFSLSDTRDCAITPAGPSLGASVSAGCAQPVIQLAQSTDAVALLDLIDRLGLYTAPVFPVETLSASRPAGISDPVSYLTGYIDPASETVLKISPLQMALAAAALSNGGLRPTPRLTISVNSPLSGSVMLPALSEPQQVFTHQVADPISLALSDTEQSVWQVIATASENGTEPVQTDRSYTWYMGGTLPGWPGVPLTVVVIVEEDNPPLALDMGRDLLQLAMHP